MQPIATQIEHAIFEPDFLRIIEFAEDGHGQVLRHTLDADLLDPKLHFAGGKFLVDRLCRARHHGPGDRHHPFGARPVSHCEGRVSRLDHALGHAVMVAQVEEQKPAMVAPPVHPAGQTNAGADLLLAQLAAGVCAIGVHWTDSRKKRGMWRGGRPQVKGGFSGDLVPIGVSEVPARRLVAAGKFHGGAPANPL